MEETYRVGYTFDAGPHAVLLIHASRAKDIHNFFYKYFIMDTNNTNSSLQGIIEKDYCFENIKLDNYLKKHTKQNSVTYMLKTQVG